MTAGYKMLVIFGPTASGKSDLAMRVARQTGAQILSVDSMQVYRHLDIGTAKPSAAEQREVLHHLIDVVEPVEEFTVARFVELADATIASATARGVPLVLTGGTPLYYKSLFEGLFAGPGADQALRDRLRALPADALHQQLREIDPTAAARLHPNDAKRLIRAIEVFELTGRSITSWQQEWGEGVRRHEAIFVGLQWEKQSLNRRINARVKGMLTAGWLDETRSLLDRFGCLSKTAGEATGYCELISHLRGPLTLDEATELIKIGTRQLARRQMKWFRRFSLVTWLDGSRDVEDLAQETIALWRRTPG